MALAHGAPAHGSAHSTGSFPPAASSSFAREKWRQPKNPFAALYGEGWAAVRT